MKEIFGIILIITANLFAQNYKDGLYADIDFLSVNDLNTQNIVTTYDPPSHILIEHNYKKVAIAFSFGFSGKINLSKFMSINYRPGFTFSSGYNGFIDFGTSIRYQAIKIIFVGIGINSKYCFTPREGNMNYSKPRNESFEYYIYTGFDLNEDIAFLLSFNDTINDQYGEIYERSGTMNSTFTKKYVYWMMKIGLEYKL